MNLLNSIRRGPRAGAWMDLDFSEWAGFFGFNGLDYPVLNQTLAGTPQEQIPPEFVGFSESAFKRNGVIFSCVAARMSLFCQARFQFKPKRSIGSSDLFGGAAL